MLKNNQVRVQFNFSKEIIERVDEMKRQTGASTRAEVLRSALNCYSWVITEKGKGLKIAAINSETKEIEEILSPFLVYSK